MCKKRSSKYILEKNIRENYHTKFTFRVDACMTNIIYYLNNHGCKTLGCCCGHGKYPMTIIHQSPNGKIWDLMSGIEIPRKKRFYLKDKEGYYFIPELKTHKV